MNMSWMEVSEIVAGYILKNELDPGAVNPLDMYEGYSSLIILKREGMEIGDITATNFSGVAAAFQAHEKAKQINGDISPLKWVAILAKVASQSRAADTIEQSIKKLKQGDAAAISEIIAAATKADTGYRELTPMSDVEPQKFKWIVTGYEPLDKHIGGLPYACMTIIGASPGIGKTTLALKICSSLLGRKENKKKYIAIFSLEMTMGQIHQRYIEIDKTLTKEQKNRILLGDSAYTVHEIYAMATKTAAIHDLGIIMVDFADLLVEGEQSEASMGVIYRTLSMLAKKTTVPVLLVSQLNREAYKGGIPRINHLRYSGLAEATARLILLPYNPLSIMIDFDKEKTPLPVVEGRAYILVGKSNFGYKEGFPGGILVDWDGESGWGTKSLGYYPIIG